MSNWLTEKEALLYGGLSKSALRSRHHRGKIPSVRRGHSLLYKEGPWLFSKASATLCCQSVSAPPVPPPQEFFNESLFPLEDIPPESAGGSSWVTCALQAMDVRAAGTLARQLVLCHPQLPPEVRFLISAFWQEGSH